MSGKKIITAQQRVNATVAAQELWPSVPKSNVTKLLRPSTDMTTNKKTVSDFGGWCARWPAFVKLGARLGPVGRIEWDAGHGQTFTSPQYASLMLFGMSGLFMPRNHLWIDQQFSAHTDHEIVTERLRWLVRSTEVLE